MAFHDTVDHSPHAARVVPSGHEHNRSELMLIAPWRKYLAFTFSSSFGSGDLHDICDAQPVQLADLPRARILVRQPSADKLVILSTRRVGKNRNACRDSALHKVSRFERPSAAGIKRYDDNVGGSDRVADDERLSCGSQTSLSDGGKGNEGNRSCDHH
jgi:hypothetical protein